MNLNNQCELMHFFSIRIGSVCPANVCIFDDESKQTRKASTSVLQRLVHIPTHFCLYNCTPVFITFSSYATRNTFLFVVCIHPRYTLWTKKKDFTQIRPQILTNMVARNPKTMFWILFENLICKYSYTCTTQC